MSWSSGLRGRLVENELLADYTTAKIGGPADLFFEPADLEDLQTFLREKPLDLPVTLLGEGSNMIVRDGGVRGCVVHLKNLNEVEIDGNVVKAQAGATCGKVARAVREAGRAGLAFWCGIPGSVGGALKMNAGCYGHETADKLVEAWVLSGRGEMKRMIPEELSYSYRRSVLPEGWLFVGGVWQLEKGDKAEIKAEMQRINKERRESQPLEKPSSGSWFKNVIQPDGSKKNAWRIVDEAGCRGLRVGDAQVSEKHCNFFVNLGNATSADVEALSQQVEKIVKDKLGIVLEREVRFIGEI